MAGIEKRYPHPSERAKIYMGAYFFAMVVGMTAQQWNAGWFWGFIILGGAPWVKMVGSYFHTVFCREGYNAAADDLTIAIVQIFEEAQIKGGATAFDLEKRVVADICTLRPRWSRDT